ncbi:MAG: hypothetical protein ACR2K1_02305 [Saprospiraceae bacterium]
MKNNIKYQVNGRYVEIPADYAHLIQMKTRKEIAAKYRISIKVLRERLSSCGMKPSSKKILPIADVIEIYLNLGWPLNGKTYQ